MTANTAAAFRRRWYLQFCRSSGTAESKTLNACTLTANTTAGFGGGVYTIAENGSATNTLINTILAGNTASTGPDLAQFFLASITLVGNNLIGDNSNSGQLASGGLIGTADTPIDPKLAPLGFYGGPTQTMPPLPGSPAIGAASLLALRASTDQTGNRRSETRLPADLGAVEAFPLSTAPNFTDTDSDGIDDRLEPAFPGLLVERDDSAVDSDGDGSPDSEELANMTDPLDNRDFLRAVIKLLTSNQVSVTANTFPGLSYIYEASPTLLPDSFEEIPRTAFTSTGFGIQQNFPLDTPRNFIRIRRK